ncbi:unnamed protein product [Didymodactylos carnosus]|nr:unnamed protein product [Didymodactylos carnosus]CAF3618994.1 unnamed protein product [Didymodactylos carnosus]
MKKLYGGIEFVIQNQSITLNGGLFVLLEDLLALVGLHGFKMGFKHAKSPCFLCTIANENMATTSSLHEIDLRTIDTYQEQCVEIETTNNRTMRDALSKQNGIVQKSLLCGLPGFNIFEQSALDVAHVYGICRKHLKLLFLSLSDKKVLSLRAINNAILNYDYPTYESTPSDTFDLTTLKQAQISLSASQMLTVVKYLPCILSNIKPDIWSNDEWRCLLLLHELLFFCFASEVDEISISQYGDLLTLFSNIRCSIRAGEKNSQKTFQFTFVKSIFSFGTSTLLQHSSFERKHQAIKASGRRNFVNTAFTAITSYIDRECSTLFDDNGNPTIINFGPKIETKKLKTVDVGMCSASVKH